MPRPNDWFEKFAKTVLVGWVGAVCLTIVLGLGTIACGLRDLPKQSNTAFSNSNPESLSDCVYRKLIEEPAWCPSEGQCVRPVVTTEEIDRHKNSCRKEGAR